MTNKTRVLNLLGLAFKAKKLITGEENVMNALKDTNTKNSPKIVFVASDASSRTIDNFSRKCFFYKVEFTNQLSTEEMSGALGKTLVKIIAVTDQGFYKSLEEILKRGELNES